MSQVDKPRIAMAVKELLLAVGEDPDRPELLETPRRVAQSYSELFSGISSDPVVALGDLMPKPPGVTSEPITLQNINFSSVCEHHLLPFLGVASVSYLPGTHLAGLGGITALIDVLASRPQIQERLTAQIAEQLLAGLQAVEVTVELTAMHQCLAVRGAKQRSELVTRAIRNFKGL